MLLWSVQGKNVKSIRYHTLSGDVTAMSMKQRPSINSVEQIVVEWQERVQSYLNCLQVKDSISASIKNKITGTLEFSFPCKTLITGTGRILYEQREVLQLELFRLPVSWRLCSLCSPCSHTKFRLTSVFHSRLFEKRVDFRYDHIWLGMHGCYHRRKHYKHKHEKPIKSLICQPSATAHAPIQVKKKGKSLILCVCWLIECFHL